MHQEVAKWVEQFRGEMDEKKRDELLPKILAYARDNVTSIPVIVQDALWAAGPRVLEYSPKPSNGYGNMHTIKVQP